MPMQSNAHTHSSWCDGKNTTREMAARAIERGFTDLGFSSHSPAPFDKRCVGITDEAGYRAEIDGLKNELSGKLNILCGVEQDFYAPVDREKYDYIIHSTHYLPRDGEKYEAVDDLPSMTLDTWKSRYNRDGYAMAKDYYRLVVEGVEKYAPDIVGHFDLITKYNQNGTMFDEESKVYRDAAFDALDAVIDVLNGYGGMIEINTGGMPKGYRSVPYPAPFLLRRMAERNVRAIITSDSHEIATLDYGYDVALELMRVAGFKRMAVLKDGAFRDQNI